MIVRYLYKFIVENLFSRYIYIFSSDHKQPLSVEHHFLDSCRKGACGEVGDDHLVHVRILRSPIVHSDSWGCRPISRIFLFIPHHESTLMVTTTDIVLEHRPRAYCVGSVFLLTVVKEQICLITEVLLKI